MSDAAVPGQCKAAMIIPVYKSGDALKVNNYRPISLQSSCAKILEQIVFKYMSICLETEDFFCHGKHGLRRGLATTTQLVGRRMTLLNFLTDKDKLISYSSITRKRLTRFLTHILLLKLAHILNNLKFTC